MIKYRLQISVLLALLTAIYAHGQEKYPLRVRYADSLSARYADTSLVQQTFLTRIECSNYLAQLPARLQTKGFVTASLDSIRFDSTYAAIVLYLGQRYQWARLDTRQVDPSLLEAVGWRDRNFTEKPMDFSQVRSWQEKCMSYLENIGYPFAKIFLDSLQLDQDKVTAVLKVDKGPLYKIDSIRVYGNAKITSAYLQRYLDITNGSRYEREKLMRINQKIRELTYVEEEKPFDITLLGTGSVVNLYLKQKKSSQVNALIGFLPNNDQLSSKKLLLTGEANILLRNSLGAGETIGLNWQQLQVKSPRLNIVYQHPYLFQSAVGLDFSFDMFRKDSSFVNVNLQLGAQYVLNKNQSGKLFIQRFQTIVSEGGLTLPM